MKNNLIYLGVFVVLLALAGYLISHSDSQDGASGAEDYQFAVSDTAAIDKIIIRDKSPGRVELRRTKGQWLVNDDFKAREDAIRLLLTTLHDMELRNFVTERAREQVERHLAVYGKEVEVYSQGQKVKHLIVGNEIPSETGTYMKLKKGVKPYAVHIPGFTGFLNTRFFTESYLWRSREIFSLESRNVREFDVVYPDSMASSYTIRRFSPDSIYLVDPRSQKVFTHANRLKMNMLLSSLRTLSYEAPIIPSDPIYARRDSLLAHDPAFTLKAVSLRGETKVVKAYRIKAAEGTFDPRQPDTAYDPDKLHGIIDNERMVLLQYYGLRNVLKPISFFERD